jgi:hypothetical protein
VASDRLTATRHDAMLSEENVVNSLATELVDEAVGASHRKGLLFLFALVLGAGIAVWFLRRNAAA